MLRIRGYICFLTEPDQLMLVTRIAVLKLIFLEIKAEEHYFYPGELNNMRNSI